jgi:hypothetical protein
VFLIIGRKLFTETSQETIRSFAVGLSGGVLGAAISIIQRGWKLPVDPFDSIIYIASQGLVRIILGAMFGTILIVMSRADIAFCSASHNEWELFGLAIAAGISERFVPDLLQRSLAEAVGGAGSPPEEAVV